MIKSIPITTLDDPELVPYRTLRQSADHFRQGVFIAEGEKVVERLLESKHEIISALMTATWLEKYTGSFSARSENINVFIGEKDLLNNIVGYNLHQGIMALGKIPGQRDIDSVLAKSKAPYLLAAVDGLTNSENLGVLVRNCVAFGVQAILVGETSSSPYLRRAVRNSMGTVFKIPVVHSDNLAGTLQLLASCQFNIFAAHPHTEENSVQRTDFSGNCCIVFGSEGNGISDRVLSVCDTIVKIPMQQRVDSLNVASASAVFLYEVTRQRNIS